MSMNPVETFRIEADELLEQIEQGLLDLTHRLDDMDLVNAVFRGLHTLKGSGAMFGFDALAAFTHHCETAFDRVRKGEVPATAELVSAVLSARDHMRALVEEDVTEAHAEAGEVLLSDLRAAIEKAGGGVVEADAPAAAPKEAQAPATTGKGWNIWFRLPANAMSNGTNPMALLAELRELGDAKIVADLSQVPPLEALSPAGLHLAWHVALRTDQPKSAIDDVFIFVMDDMELKVEPLADEAAPELRTAAAAADAPKAASAPVAQADASTGDARQSKSSENVRVPAERLDELMDRVGELVIAQSRLSQIAAMSTDLHLRSVSEEIERLSGELRDTMMVLRMVPVSTLFGRFRRLVHDLARETGKAIDLVTEGESTEVDKTVIERLADPLVHLVRNSIDHGLELPEAREAAGKPRTGQVKLSARQAGGEVIIKITDDGRGIDRDKVRAKAEASGLIEPGQQISEHDLLQFIFHPGFSTAQKVTNLSGRGVGMDVVKRTIESLRGTIDMVSTAGTGSEISLRIPLTVAIIDGLLVRVGEGRYVIPLAAVEECIELSLEDDLRSRGRSFISLRDKLVPFLRLRDLFETGTKPDPHQKIVVISTGSERVGLVVDQIIGDHQTVIKSMSKLHANVATFSGATILGDGTVALILDVAHLVAAGQQQEAQLRAAG
ncbi:MAG: chemotaxis protein CheA [Alphaproteobacteria bacterium]|nr:chemotaxis protein CheA [Alphaproteobacteria bacterium]MDX5415566.1 chemotaxis protein CheA [Alphaproteobacteria bacterium]MDX5492806.1 chemotaxis protein CheA [Alphaproteobacteria bacterium]